MKAEFEKWQELNVPRNRIFEGCYYFRCYSKKSQFVIQFSGEAPRDYPLTYTYQECVEDWCDRYGYGFGRLKRQVGVYWGSGYFEYYKHLR